MTRPSAPFGAMPAKVCTLFFAVSLWGCTHGKDDTGDALRSPCSDGSWGAITKPSSAIVLRSSGDDDAPGTLDEPVATLSHALDLALATTPQEILLGPDTFEDVSVEFDTAHSGLILQGCPDETVLESSTDDNFVLRISGATGVVLNGFSTSGGARALWFWQGADVSVDTVEVSHSTLAGVVIDGHETFADLGSLKVTEPLSFSTGDHEPAYGIAVRYASVNLHETTVTGAVDVGILISGYPLDTSGSAYELTDVTVEGVTPDPLSGDLGRGVHVQQANNLVVDGLGISDVSDVGLFVLQNALATLDGVSVNGVSAITGVDADGVAYESGDGVVVTAITDDATSPDPARFVTEVNGAVVSDAVRAGLLLEQVTATVDGSALSGGAYGIVSSGEAVLDGSDASSAEAVDLPMNHALLDDTLFTE